MDGVSGMGGIPGGDLLMRPNPLAGMGGAPAAEMLSNSAPASVPPGQSLASLSATSISARVESFVADHGPVLADKQLLGLIVLLLTLEYLQSDDEEEKKGLMALMLALSQQQQASGPSFVYSSSSLSVESTQIQAASTETAINSYSGSAGAAQPPPGTDSASGLDVVA